MKIAGSTKTKQMIRDGNLEPHKGLSKSFPVKKQIVDLKVVLENMAKATQILN